MGPFRIDLEQRKLAAIARSQQQPLSTVNSGQIMTKEFAVSDTNPFGSTTGNADLRLLKPSPDMYRSIAPQMDISESTWAS